MGCLPEDSVVEESITEAEFSTGDIMDSVHDVTDVEMDEVANCAVTTMGVNHDNPSDWVHVPAGSFVIGCTPERDDGFCDLDEGPPACITISKSFEMMRYEVTRGLFQDVFGEEITNSVSSKFNTPCVEDDCPMMSMSWLDGVLLANAMSERDGLERAYIIESLYEDEPWDVNAHWQDASAEVFASVEWNRSANGYRLPTEAEWRYAAHAGQNTRFAGSNDLSEVAWTAENSPDGPQKVGLLEPNALGLHDMTGNQWEWVWDGSRGYDPYQYENMDRVDPSGPDEVVFIAPDTDSNMIAKRDCGGAWDGDTDEVSAIVRRNNTPIGNRYGPMGHRLVRPIE